MDGSCPIPQIEEALRPYIYPRSEAQRIRQALSKDLQHKSGAKNEIAQLSAWAGKESRADATAIAEGDDLHNRYLQALAAHDRAQATFVAVKADLEELRQATTVSQRRAPTSVGSIREYVSSQRQKKQQNKLEAVERALSRLDDLEPHPVKNDIKYTVKHRLGPPPDAPHYGYQDESVNVEVDELTVALKKAIIQARTDLDTAKSDRDMVKQRIADHGKVDVKLRLSAFQAARQELIQWIESELTKVADHDEQPHATDEHNLESEHSQQDVQAQVSNLYDRYVSSRQALVQNVESVASAEPEELPGTQISKDLMADSPVKTSKQSLLTATQLLAFLPLLMQVSKDEAAVLQQTSFVQKQFNLGANETKQILQRLAGESHLVSPDASSTQAWAAATQESTSQTQASVTEYVKAGSESMDHARERLAVVQAKRSALVHLKADS